MSEKYNIPEPNSLDSMEGGESIIKPLDLEQINYEKQKLARALNITLKSEHEDKANRFKKNRENQNSRGETLGGFEVGDIVEAEITKIERYGLFVRVGDGLESMIHGSRVSMGYSFGEKSLQKDFSVGDKIEARVINIKNEKLELDAREFYKIKEELSDPVEVLLTNFRDNYKNSDIVNHAIEEQNKHRDEKKSFLEPGASFVDGFSDDSPYKDFLRIFMQDRPVVDLGCGMESRLTAVKYTFSYGASKYIGIDLTNKNNISTNSEGQVIRDGEVSDKSYFFQEDILKYLANSADESSNVALNGIDSSILTSNEYCALLAMHIHRVVPTGGIVFGVSSEPVFNLLEKVGFKKILSRSEGFKMEVFVKM